VVTLDCYNETKTQKVQVEHDDLQESLGFFLG